MINPIEFKLKAYEFKILQYLKIKNDDTHEEMAYQLNTSSRGVSNNLKMLELLNVISINLKGEKYFQGHYYTINEVEKWTI